MAEGMRADHGKLMRAIGVIAGAALLGPLIVLALSGRPSVVAARRAAGASRPPRNLIPNPWAEAGRGSRPSDWRASAWGRNVSVFRWTGNPHVGERSLRVTMTSYVTGAAKWYFKPISTARPGMTYLFSTRYKATTQPTATAAYRMANGTVDYEQAATPLMGSGAAVNWQRYRAVLTVPAGARSMTVALAISGVGWLDTEGYSLTPDPPVGFRRAMVSLDFDDGWQSTYVNGLPLLREYGLVSTQFIVSGKIGTPGRMTVPEIRAFQREGSEIGSHTVDHPNLAKLSAGQIGYQLSQSQATLRRLFGKGAAVGFASPYGAYDSRVISAIKSYYRSHRSIDAGYNSRNGFNRYDIVVQNVRSTTTPSQVYGWVRHAVATRTWLVIVYHQVRNAIPPGEPYAVTTADLKMELARIKASGAAVVTMRQALARIAPQV